jgi:hypothetical protein
MLLPGDLADSLLAEYQVADRAKHWAVAYLWAANHLGIGPRL